MKNIIEKYMVPPGFGVYTVNTAKERKEQLCNLLYGNEKNPTEEWKKTLDNVPNNDLLLYAIPSDNGGGILRGANWGPLFLRTTFLKLPFHEQVFDLGDIRVIPHLLHDKYLNQETLKSCREALYQNPEGQDPVSPLSIAYEFCKSFHHTYPTKKLIMLGGDHSVSYPAVRAYLESAKRRGKTAAILHFDAHTDLLDKRLGIDLCFGSWAFHIRDLLKDHELLVQVGIRSSGKERNHWESHLGVTQFWSSEVQSLGENVIAKKISEIYTKHKVDEIYVSFDIDALDAKYASRTGTPEIEGLDPAQCSNIIKSIADKFPITGADLVEVAPMTQAIGDRPHSIEPDTTLQNGALIINLFAHLMR